ncbi:MAG: PilZ domain-containing protein [Hyphomonadaceae bacterium]|nr:PilZ domain-containing protein [Hyphomonadaceae bacterium]
MPDLLEPPVSFLKKLMGRTPEPEPELPEEPVEHRRAHRAGTYKVVSVTYPSGYVRKGIAVDLSATGVRVRFSQRGELPAHVDLKIDGVPGVLSAEVVWQETYDAGLKFVS